MGLPWRGLVPLPDVDAEDQGDRQQAAGYYRGILAAVLGINDIPLLLFTDVTVIRASVTALTVVRAMPSSLTVVRAGVTDLVILGG